MTPEMLNAIARGVRDGVVFRAGASDVELRMLEERIGLALPDELRAFYLAHDGAEGIGVATNDDLLAVGQIMESWMVLCDVWSEIDAEPGMWSALWLPVTDDGGGSFLCVDLGAGAGETPVLRYLHGEPERPRIASSFTQWLATVEWTCRALEPDASGS
ncbi:MAG: SMI1/KNR4 family protein [Deltaproteobacteria bacterium]|nr:SMI1/KNR4 family protein [Deltaproteobacteria bacterium]MDQ3295631.1 SMI1/KNR4 family protein [Myxococcota bacterium]